MARTHLLATLAVISSAIGISAATPKPNILYIYADDLGWGYIGANGQTKVLTPNLDTLASTGVNFTRGYGCTVCSPARSSQQTGFHQGHTWTDRNDPDSSKAIRADDKTIGDMLSQAGYRTAYFGKWGYGADKEQNNPAINNTQTLPINHGYDVMLAELHHVRAHTFFQPTLWRSNTSDQTPTTALVPNAIPNNPTLPTYPAHQDDPGYPSPAYCDDAYATNALEFVRAEAQDTSKPFFCLLAFQIPHTPLGEIAGLPKWFDAYNAVDTSGWSGNSKQFAAMVTRMDAHIGNLLDALEDPNHDGDKSDSVLENTLIVFASDNGGQSSGGAGDALSEFTGNGVLRGAKGAIYEGAIRVPMIMKWQGKLAAGGTSTQVVDVTDMLPTFCELAGIDAPAGLDGVSLAPTLTGNGHQRTRDFIIHEAGSNSSIIRGDFKLISKNSSRELYNLATDPSESNNIATSNSALADELEVLLLGERTKEGDNFANTYHHWTGSNNGDLSDASNWSDYDYSNNSISYLSDSGAPRVSWTARIENTTSSDSTAVANSSVSFLSLHIKGGSHKQSVNLTNHTITGRNEIRISENATLLLDNGTLDSLRWVDVQEGGNITGAGGINGSLYHSGSLKVSKTSPTSTSSNGTEIVLNGGFETGNGSGSYSYTDLANWMTNGSDPSLNGSVNNTAQAGNNRGLIQGAASDRDIYQNTTDTIALGDSYTFSFWHQGFSGWSTGEEMKARLYYLNAGNPVTIFTQTLALTNGTWKQETYNVPAIADTNAVGKQLHISFSPANGATGYASIDSVSLLKNGTPTSIPGHCRLTISKDYHVSASATTDVLLGGTTTPGEDYAQIIVAEKATLNGSLTASLEDGYTPNTGDTFIILTASEITGKFQHADDTITIGDHSFSIIYNAQSVVLKKVSTTAKGTPHSWLDSHGLSPNYEQEDLADGDNDGIPTWQEFIAGTNPADSTSVFRATVEPLSVTENAITWELKPARRYYIESSDSLGGFSVIAGPFTGDDSSFTYPLPITAEPKRFYRIRVERM